MSVVTKEGTNAQRWFKLEALGIGGLRVGWAAALVLVSVAAKSFVE